LGNGGCLFPLELPQTFFHFTQLCRVHFQQWSYLPQVQMLLLSECSYLLTKLAFHRLNVDLSNIGNINKRKGVPTYFAGLQSLQLCNGPL
jgi:hypothetical protein